LGVYKKQNSTSIYQLTDHLGDVRAVISRDQSSNAAALVSATDYYPFGMPMPNRQLINGEPHRYAYQGQEKDSETGKEAFQLRLWDGKIGRWLTTDLARLYASPYVGMGNDPINGIDPDGGIELGLEHF
jgi:RHS repeat-associated protein